MVEGVQKQINQISPVIGVLDFLTGRWDERLVDFSIQIARDGAWDFALAYANTSKERKHELLLEGITAPLGWVKIWLTQGFLSILLLVL